ncbi:peptidoglycan bridge formation glycyltransferase FemA/FemB family protein [Algibacter sp. 2305UL17-15]|uniref:peptidoglycan bridge formation glycyltransferase FemA/FemB family protein n=1 Tax=Algibacter sp. 2305UL17-15 TaxID=3231268 RepID=UPI00345B25FD
MSIAVIEHKKDWNDFLSLVEAHDCYHTYDYHQLSKSPSDAAVLIKYVEDDVIIGLPLLIREINGTKFYDAISVYGYSGPISKGISSNFSFKNYKEALMMFFKTKNIISVFVRLNPYLPYQNIVFHSFGELTYLGKVVNINLSLSLEKQRHKYHRRLKNQVNKAYRECTIKPVKNFEDFQIFKKIYFENMDRVNAKQFYYFDDIYFKSITNAKDFKTSIKLAFDNATGTPVAGCLFIMVNDIVQYHLSAASKDFLHLNATKLLIDTMRLEATEKGYKNFNLGGGLGANENDSLFRFKSSFSDEFRHFFIWKLIVNKSKYNKLCKQNKVINNTSGFFPLYRYEEFNKPLL